MNKLIIAATITSVAALFSSVATAGSGLADRISDARSYPNKTVSTESEHDNCHKQKKYKTDIINSERKYEEIK